MGGGGLLKGMDSEILSLRTQVDAPKPKSNMEGQQGSCTNSWPQPDFSSFVARFV